MILGVYLNSHDGLFVGVGNIKSHSHFLMVGEKKLSSHGILLNLLNVLPKLTSTVANLRVYLYPLIQTLGAVANLTVDSQVQFYAGLTFDPEKRDNEYIVPLDKLPGFVNSAEWNLGLKTCKEIYTDN
jgi:hypothetical protein